MTIILTREEAQQVLDLMTRYRTETPLGHQPHMISHKADEAIETLRARLAQPEPEPVAWLHSFTGYGWQVVPEKLYPTDQPLYTAPPKPEPKPVTDKYLMEVECTKCGAKQDGVLTVTVPPQPEPGPMRLRRGDILRCIETNELCTVWATSTTGKTLVKWKANDFGEYTAEQIGDLFWVEPKPEPEPVAWDIKHNRPPLSSDNPHEVVAVIKREWRGLTDEEIKQIVGGWGSLPIDGYTRKLFDQIEAKLKEKNA